MPRADGGADGPRVVERVEHGDGPLGLDDLARQPVGGDAGDESLDLLVGRRMDACPWNRPVVVVAEEHAGAVNARELAHAHRDEMQQAVEVLDVSESCRHVAERASAAR